MGRLTKEEQKRRAELLAKGLKVCYKCGRELPVEQFSKDKTKKDGLNSKCKECLKQYEQEHKEEKREYRQQYYQEHKEEKREYRQQNKEKIQQYKQQYYQENKEQIQQYRQQYWQTPRGQVIHFNAYNRRKTQLENNGGELTLEQWKEMMEFFGWECAYSGKSVGTKKNRSIDHIIPVSMGGHSNPWNCVPMDKSLNSSKKDKDMLEWYKQQEFYSEDRLQRIYEWQQYAYNKWSKQDKEFAL